MKKGKSTKKKLEPFEIGELDQYLFGQGNHYEIYEKMGAHKVTYKGKEGVYFAVWAPNARRVAVVGDFNGWDFEADYMERQEPVGIYTCFVPGVKEGDLYKFCIETQQGKRIFKADPFANYAELRPGTASRVTDISNLKWTDSAWMTKRETWDHKKNPMSIYEVHLGSWMRHPGREDEGFYTYREFADAIVKYVKDMGYTHVELMGMAEHPFDGSWGYQVTGYYAPTSRYGTPEEFAYMINELHRNNIGVILDWVPAHFPRDAHGLAEFDGTPTFEYADPRKGEHPDWGTKIFDYGKPEVKNFLIANALFWIEHYHVDGLRVDAVASMLYLDYGKQDGQWVANKYGGNENLEAIEFFKHLNSVVLGRNKGAVMIAEESTAWPKVTGAPEDGGLGFSLKWNMGWMHDFTEYMKLDPYFRKNAHHMMTFASSYAYSENYILVLSHDEVVHLKCSMLNKMPGLGFDKYANLKAGYAFMTGHPGKKLLFMGQEFAQLREWSEERELDWFLLAEPEHQAIQNWYRDLLHLYKKNKALYEMDSEPEGFEWINADDIFRSIYSFERHSKDNKKNLLFVCNFTPMERPDYRVGVTRRKQLKLVLNSDEKKYGGSGAERPLIYKPVKQECDGQKYSISYPLPAYGVAVFEF
ncbi:1,4-alpha-glucan branching protein GlgB [Mediterraneibacter glycyrrhizinilyticus]|uniref:1,4-alpha-glucan branching protein GlgB n=1 Tax=Mediterraneibacter glycyrrhizinilyticus TaxID=342942 RepID=UPI0025A3218F|nr:1,4-alpha-glucan branching protein GlgB [Mediterraneibacter glycyrrhizinilyticus]MDM8211838.1 1,4-alpha-glucan branching protein GlgB [Mediterraneibacter glycyrrhizinilyticus]